MDHHSVDLTDWHRLLVGKLPWTFLIEVLLRASVIYLLLMLAMRLLGKRVAAQLTLFELSVVVTLAATIGVPLESSKHGLLPAMVILAVVILLHRGLSLLALRHRGIEKVMSGDIALLVQDGCLLLHNLRRVVLPREKLYAILRGSGVQHLGEVGRLYLEPSGSFTLIRAQPPAPGLSILPDFDAELRREAMLRERFVCQSCGKPAAAAGQPTTPCPVCGAGEWTEAVETLRT